RKFNMAEGHEVLIEPLCFSQHLDAKPLSYKQTRCLMCEDTFNLDTHHDTFLKHLVEKHKLVIADVKLIADFKRYINYWRGRFSLQDDLKEFCTIIRTNTQEKDIVPSEDFYLLSDIIDEDKKLREILQREKLECVLMCQQSEREEGFHRCCLFCKLFDGSKNELFEHMSEEHGFNIGQPDNIVYADELMDYLHEQLKLCKCLYCEKTFKDRVTLKEHMRKKGHKRLNPKSKKYDKYYIINYLELGKNWKSIQSEDDTPIDSDTDKDEDWSDWQEMGGAKAVCLFCDWSATNVDILWEHIQKVHDFNMTEVKEKLQLTFYQQIKLVNYIRRQIHQSRCINCDDSFESKKELLQHMSDRCHFSQPTDSSVWDQPQYFFPTYEDDNLLYALQDDDAASNNGNLAAIDISNDEIIAESAKTNIKDSVLCERTILQDLREDGNS
ncbi:unnamed protein product, partial [Owenia fusiformis]